MPKALSWCYSVHFCRGSSDGEWRQKVTRCAEENADDKALALSLGKIMVQHQVAWYAVPLFKIALEGTKDSPACKDEDVKKALDSAAATGESSDEAGVVGKACGLKAK